MYNNSSSKTDYQMNTSLPKIKKNFLNKTPKSCPQEQLTSPKEYVCWSIFFCSTKTNITKPLGNNLLIKQEKFMKTEF